jgi:crossover junction endodeoxyribonuclease RuvC
MILGVDPGLTGAIAFFSQEGALIEVHDMPTTTVKVGGKPRQRVCAIGLKNLIARAPVGSRAFLEQVGPSTSAAGSFTFGRSVGVVEGVLAVFCIPVTLVSPQRWKPALGCAGRDKSVSRAQAAMFFPSHAHLFNRVKDDGRAESCLIGLYGAQCV